MAINSIWTEPDGFSVDEASAAASGTAAMATRGDTMADIARKVASPRGTTEQGLAVLDAPGGLKALVEAMLAAAIGRGEELAAAARLSHGSDPDPRRA